MASIQEIETQLSVLEDKVDFILNHFRFRAVVPTGVLGPDGKPTASVREATLFDLYRDDRQNQLKGN